MAKAGFHFPPIDSFYSIMSSNQILLVLCKLLMSFVKKIINRNEASYEYIYKKLRHRKAFCLEMRMDKQHMDWFLTNDAFQRVNPQWTNSSLVCRQKDPSFA